MSLRGAGMREWRRLVDRRRSRVPLKPATAVHCVRTPRRPPSNRTLRIGSPPPCERRKGHVRQGGGNWKVVRCAVGQAAFAEGSGVRGPSSSGTGNLGFLFRCYSDPGSDARERSEAAARCLCVRSLGTCGPPWPGKWAVSGKAEGRQLVLQGLSNGTPIGSKSRTLRVTTVKR